MDLRKESCDNSSKEECHVTYNSAKLKVCGMSYEIRWQTLLKNPRTRLGRLAISFHKNAPYNEVCKELEGLIRQRNRAADSLDFQYSVSALKYLKNKRKLKDPQLRTFCDGYDQNTDQFYFERDPTAFVAILNFHVTGHLHIPRSKCVKSFEDEVTYWGIPFDIEPCCDSYYCDQWEHTEAIRKADQLECTLMKQERASMDTKKLELYLKKLWNLFEHPATSIAAKIVSLVSNLSVILSTIVLCLNTHPDLQHILPNGEKLDNPHLARIELVCIIWFTIEYIARLISCPNKKQFLKGGLNIIDLLAILPYYMQLIFEKALGRVDTNFISIRRFIQIMRIIRIARIFKLARHSTGLQVLGYTMKESSQELSLLALLLMMGVTLFATLVYYAEEHVPGTKFKSILEGFWWATVSMTTVGYGDMNPVTTFGKIIGSCCCVCGILFIALPIPTIVGNFSKYYSEHQNKQKIKKYKMDRTRKISNFRSWASAVRPSTEDV